MMEGLSGAQTERRILMIDATYPKAHLADSARQDVVSGHEAERELHGGWVLQRFPQRLSSGRDRDRLPHGLRQSAATRLTDAYCSEAQ